MIIDFHTHAFPDKIAQRTVDALASESGMTPLTDGTVAGLKERLAESGVDLGVILPVVTRPEQFAGINRFAASVCETGLISFGGIHPDDGAPEAHVKEIASLGLKGIKLHPDYQRTFVDDERYVRIVTAALAEGLIVVTHAGVDVGFPGHPVRCTPERAARLLDRISDGKEELPIVFAHGGGYEMHADVMRHLAGRGVYVDLSMTHRMSNEDEVTELVRAHGAERVLFGSDCPWGDPKETADFVRSLDLTDAEKDAILGGNAKRLLGI